MVLDIKANLVAEHCIESFNQLPKRGKPIEDEWTVLSCIVKLEADSIEMVALGTGSKCIGANKMSFKGDILNDSHAEICARRGYLIYLYEQIESALSNKQSIFLYEQSKFRLKDGISFVFYSSQLPCGDASIIPKSIDSEDFGNLVNSIKRPADNDICDISSKIAKNTVSDIHRTGAKCLPSAQQDSKETGINYHTLGQVRLKPGRGDQTLSVSCSDKLARWIHVGIQGALLDMLLAEPIYMTHFIFGAGVPYCKEALDRAFFNRSNADEIKVSVRPVICQCDVVFPKIKSEQNVRPSPNSIVWMKSFGLSPEVAVMGKKLGATKKSKSLNSALSISKLKLYKRFISILKKSNIDIGNKEELDKITYKEMKRKALRYQNDWTQVKDKFFKVWTVKPDMWNFNVKEEV